MAHLPAARFVHWQERETDGRVVAEAGEEKGKGSHLF